MREENFFYTTGWSLPSAAAGTALDQNIQISSDAPFKAYYITAISRQGALNNEVIVVNFAGNVQINDSQVGKNLFNVAGAFVAIQGDGRQPYIIAPPRILAANTTIIFTTTFNVATRTEVQYVLHGAKLFKS